MRGDARALGAQRLFGDLHQDFLAFFQDLRNLDRRRVSAARRLAPKGSTFRARRARNKSSAPFAAAARRKAWPLVRLTHGVSAFTGPGPALGCGPFGRGVLSGSWSFLSGSAGFPGPGLRPHLAGSPDFRLRNFISTALGAGVRLAAVER